MSKLGYTFYPKDWASDEKVFELLLDERGFYRELIDLAMLNDNKTIVNTPVWCRKYAINESELERLLITLVDKGCIEFFDEILFIPSCEKRLKLVRGGRNGGKISKPTTKPISKPIVKPTTKPIVKQREKKEKGKESKVYRKFAHLSITIDETNKILALGYKVKQVNAIFDSIENYAKNKSYTSLYLTTLKWIKKEHPLIEAKQEKKKDQYGNDLLDISWETTQ